MLQVEGLQWLWSVWTLNQGGILADDMGLGCGLTQLCCCGTLIIITILAVVSLI